MTPAGLVIVGGSRGPRILDVGEGARLTTETVRTATGETEITVLADGSLLHLFKIGSGIVRAPIVVIQFDNLDRNLLVLTVDAQGMINGAQLVWNLPWEGFGLINVAVNDLGFAMLDGVPDDDSYHLRVFPIPGD